MKETFPPESSRQDETIWKAFPGPETEWIDFQKFSSSPGVVYARTEVTAEHDEALLMGLAVDYYCQVWVNGESKVVLDGPHGKPQNKIFFPARLRKGRNTIMIKLGSGSQGFGFSLALVRSPHFAHDKRLIP